MTTITIPRRRSIESTRCLFGGAYVTASKGAVVAAAVAICTSGGGWGGKPALRYRAPRLLARWNKARSHRTYPLATFFKLTSLAPALKSMASNIPADVVVIGGGPGGYV